jgi:23S rRNA A1618 N6-methylase RlmF
LFPSWHFDCTDIDPSSVQWARENVVRNGLQQRINVHLQPDPMQVLPVQLLLSTKSYDFVICNPPFYSSNDCHVAASSASKPSIDRECVASRSEMITEGGELAFCRRMFMESQQLPDDKQVGWYTCLFGRKRDMEQLYGELSAAKQRPIKNLRHTTLIQGRTRRWVLAWSFRS